MIQIILLMEQTQSQLQIIQLISFTLDNTICIKFLSLQMLYFNSTVPTKEKLTN